MSAAARLFEPTESSSVFHLMLVLLRAFIIFSVVLFLLRAEPVASAEVHPERPNSLYQERTYQWLNQIPDDRYTIQLGTFYGFQHCRDLIESFTAAQVYCLESSTVANRFFAVSRVFENRAAAQAAAEQYRLKNFTISYVPRIVGTRCEMDDLPANLKSGCGQSVAVNKEAPEQPTATVPEQPTAAAPEQPTAAAPEQPTAAAPAQPTAAAPAQPTATAPAQPAAATPAQPAAAAPEQPAAAAPKQPTTAAPEQPTAAVPEQPTATVPEQPAATPPSVDIDAQGHTDSAATTDNLDTGTEPHTSDASAQPTHTEAHDYTPAMSERARQVQHDSNIFKSDPVYEEFTYDAKAQLEIYGGKRAVVTPRPLLELGRPQYQNGPLTRSHAIIGERNRIAPTLLVYGDWRTAVASNDDGLNKISQIATRLNLDIDLKLTGTERIHAFVRPFDNTREFSRYEFSREIGEEQDEFILDGNLETLFFEGDLGSIMSGLSGKPSSFDLPFAVGKMPLLFQNGMWLEDAFTGIAFTIPARNSPALDISNYDLTFFAGFDDVSNLAIRDEAGRVAEDNVNVYGFASFFDVFRGYVEFDYAFIDGQDEFDDFDHHSLSFAFSKRYKDIASSTIRILRTFGQDLPKAQETAGGSLVVWENSLITSKPTTLVPYLNLYAGFDRPQSVARDNGGLLKTVGINFESDALTGFPLLDDSGQDSWGGALGLEYLFSLNQQLVVEAAMVQLMDEFNPLGKALGDQYAIGIRYQRPLSKTWIIRADAIRGWQDNREDIVGVRVEIRRKF